MTIFLQGRFRSALGHRPRLTIALIIGLILGLCLPANINLIRRAVIGWDLAAIIYLILTITTLFHTSSPETLKAIVAKQDQKPWIILIIMTIACFVSLIAVFTLLAEIKNLSPATMHLHVILGVVTVVASWSMMQMIYAVHYTHEYYGDADSSPDSYEAYEGLIFPGGKQPVFSDFIYYAYIIGMTCQVSDVQVSSHAMRRLTLAHGILAFFFNTVVLALSVNIGASMLGS